MKNVILFTLILFANSLFAQDTFQPLDVYDLEFATDPTISPDGKKVVYSRTFMDVMTDRRLSNLWMMNLDGSGHRPLTTGLFNNTSPAWSPDGSKIAYSSNESGKSQVHIYWTDSGYSAQITNLQSGFSNMSWSPDGKWLVGTMRVKAKPTPFGNMPAKPKGAKWAESPKYFDKLTYRSDGAGYIGESYNHIFILPADGGTPRQITSGDFNHGSPEWSKDGSTIYFSANRAEDWEYERQNSELFSVGVASGTITQLTDRYGGDNSPKVSPSGNQIAYTGNDDNKMGYQHSHVYIMDADGENKKVLTDKLDFSFGNVKWAKDGKGLYVQYDEHGASKVGFLSLKGKLEERATELGSSSIGRPYGGGSYDVSDGVILFTRSTAERPSELAIVQGNSAPRNLTSLNEDVLGHKVLGEVQEIWYSSSFDNQKIQGWIVTPPEFDPSKKYPLILEIHGGPFANYGPRFTPEIQLMASRGFVVLYTNPRGSTSYGADFANLIHHNYPSQDHDDLMSGVDALLAKGYIDPDRLFITGGSGGGVLTSWAIGKTDRFAAAVVAKPVINWVSWALTADIAGVVEYWFPGDPWDNMEHYMKRSPISLVGNVQTPTMLLTGEEDYRTPMSESEQYYQALKMRKIPASLVRIQGASHGIASRPSNLLAKVAYITSWFEAYDPKKETSNN